MALFQLAVLMKSAQPDSPTNMLAMFAQLGLKNPGQLAQLMAGTGAVPPPIESVAPASPTVGSLMAAGMPKIGEAGGGGTLVADSSGIRQIDGASPVVPTPVGASTSPLPGAGMVPFNLDQTDNPWMNPDATAAMTQPWPGPQPNPMDKILKPPSGILQALGGLQAPKPPAFPAPPSPVGVAGGGLGGSMNPALLNTLMALLRPPAGAQVPTLGQLMTGGK